MNRRGAFAALGRPPGFVYRSTGEGSSRNGQRFALHSEGVSLAKLAEKYGTPLYVYSATAIRERVAAFRQAFHSVRHTLCYSVKANSNLSILRMLAREGCGFDVVSGGELERVLTADRTAARRTVFSGVGKTRNEMSAALKAGILLFNLESEAELYALAECATKLRKEARIAFRVNPDVAADTHPYISTGLHKHKFGVPIGSAVELYARASETKYLKVSGVSVHIGSQITDVAPFAETTERVAALVRQLRADGHNLDYVDIGGGLGISYQAPELDFTRQLARYARAVSTPLRGLNLHLLMEPGRSIIGSAGVLLTSVLYKKQNNGKRFLIVDAAMNDLIRPALYGAHHEIVPISQPANSASDARETVDVVGPVCESGDFFARDRELPHVEEGDLLAILDAGAYGMALASNYNTRPRPAEALVSGKSVKLIRPRETIRQLYSAEL
jgi:diaminopimelate decarboxylase